MTSASQLGCASLPAPCPLPWHRVPAPLRLPTSCSRLLMQGLVLSAKTNG